MGGSVYAKLGLGFSAIVQLSLIRQKSTAVVNFIDHISRIDEIVECLQLTGNFDYQLKIVAKDIPSFEKILEEKLGQIEEIGQMQTSVVLATKKSSPIAPLDYKSEIRLEG